MKVVVCWHQAHASSDRYVRYPSLSRAGNIDNDSADDLDSVSTATRRFPWPLRFFRGRLHKPPDSPETSQYLVAVHLPFCTKAMLQQTNSSMCSWLRPCQDIGGYCSDSSCTWRLTGSPPHIAEMLHTDSTTQSPHHISLHPAQELSRRLQQP